MFSDSSRGLRRRAGGAGSIRGIGRTGAAQPGAVPVGSADGGRPFMRVVRAPTLAMTLATSIIIHRGTDRDDRQPTGDLRRSVFARRPRAGAPGVFRTHAPGALKSTRAYPLSAIAIQFALECRFLTYY